MSERGVTPNPASEDRRDYTVDPSRTETPDHIQGLIDLLDAAPDPDGAIRLPGGHAVRVRRVADGRANRTGPPVTTDPKTEAALERANKLDRAWFLRHPERAHRVRKLVPGEPLIDDTPPHMAGLPVYVVVKQIAPGLRFKFAFWGTLGPCDCEACSSDLWLKLSPPGLQSLAIEAAAIMLRRSA